MLDTLYNEFASLSPKILRRDDVAIILPLVFYDLGMVLNQCRELSQCVKVFVVLSACHVAERIICQRIKCSFPYASKRMCAALRRIFW